MSVIGVEGVPIKIIFLTQRINTMSSPDLENTLTYETKKAKIVKEIQKVKETIKKSIDYKNAVAMYDIRMSAKDMYEYKQIAKDLRRYAKQFTFQLERGTQITEANPEGYLHFQGRISLIKRKRKPELIATLKELKVPIPNYLEPTANPTYYKGDMFYVLKEETRISGPWTDKDKEFEEVYLPYQYLGIKERFYPFQKQVYDSAELREARKINYVFDPKGNKGKSSVASIMEIEGNAIDLPPANDLKEMLQVACDECYERTRNPKVIFIDLPRAMEKTRLYGIYSGIEQIKKGKLYDCRYNYKKWWIDAPQIWVFSNRLPDLKALSADRWIVWTINDKYELEPYKETVQIQVSPPTAESPLDHLRGRGISQNRLMFASDKSDDEIDPLAGPGWNGRGDRYD